MTERFQWIHKTLTNICDGRDLDYGYALVAKSLADDEFYSDEEVVKGLRMATRLYNEQKGRISNPSRKK